VTRPGDREPEPRPGDGEPSRRATADPPRRTTAEPPRRTVVTNPRAGAARRPPGRSALRALDEQDVVGELLVRSLVRAQLSLALKLLSVLALVVGGLPLLFALVPASRDAQVLGLQLPWLVLGVLVHPAVLVGGWVYVRLAERNERDFTELVERS
jgi:hypothetical protein